MGCEGKTGFKITFRFLPRAMGEWWRHLLRLGKSGRKVVNPVFSFAHSKSELPKTLKWRCHTGSCETSLEHIQRCYVLWCWLRHTSCPSISQQSDLNEGLTPCEGAALRLPGPCSLCFSAARGGTQEMWRDYLVYRVHSQIFPSCLSSGWYLIFQKGPN